MMRTGNDYSIRMAIGLAIFACCSIITFESTGNAAGIKVETVFGPEVPTGPYKHPSCFDELDNGDLYLVYYGGQGEYAGGTALFGSRLKKGSGLWSEPEMIAGNPVMARSGFFMLPASGTLGLLPELRQKFQKMEPIPGRILSW